MIIIIIWREKQHRVISRICTCTSRLSLRARLHVLYSHVPTYSDDRIEVKGTLDIGRQETGYSTESFGYSEGQSYIITLYYRVL